MKNRCHLDLFRVFRFPSNFGFLYFLSLIKDLLFLQNFYMNFGKAFLFEFENHPYPQNQNLQTLLLKILMILLILIVLNYFIIIFIILFIA